MFWKKTRFWNRKCTKTTIVLDEVVARTAMYSLVDVESFAARGYEMRYIKEFHVCAWRCLFFFCRYVHQTFSRELDGFRTATNWNSRVEIKVINKRGMNQGTNRGRSADWEEKVNGKQTHDRGGEMLAPEMLIQNKWDDTVLLLPDENDNIEAGNKIVGRTRDTDWHGLRWSECISKERR